MKKILFAIAAVAALASCSKNEADNNAAGQKAIAFSNLNDKVNSRAANDAGDDYKVYAKSNLAGENTWFINDVIDGTTNMAENGPYYWPAAPIVDFYAYAPATAGVVTSNYPSTLSIEYTVPVSADEDFTVASPMLGMGSGTVNFEFSHMLSKISVNAELTQALQDAGYTIAFDTWELVVSSNGGSIDLLDVNGGWASYNSTVANYTGTGATSFIVMPLPDPTGTEIQLRGVVISKGGAEVFNGDLNVYTLTGLACFEQGKHYMMNFTIGSSSTDDNGDPILGSEILFSADIYADWDTPAGHDTPIAQP